MKFSKIFVLLVLFYLLQFSCKENGIEKIIDNVPRNRIVSNEELIKYISIQKYDLPDFYTALTGKDTAKAISIFGKYLKDRNNVKYYFDSENIEQRVKNINTRYPEYAKQIQKEAEKFIKTYGRDIDWIIPGKDLLGQSHTPNTLRYVARQPQAVNIALSFLLTNDKTYKEVLFAQIKDFVDDYEAGKTQTGANRVFERFYAGIRLRNWVFAYNLLKNDMTPKEHIYMLKVFLLHGARLIDDCERFHWGNHQLHGLEGLYEMTILFPEMKIMQEWNKKALEVTMQHISREIKDDGFQFERASHYFKKDIINYFRIYKVSERNDIDLPELYNYRFHRMFDAIVAVIKPNGVLPVLQDSQDNKPTGNDVAELQDFNESVFMSLGALIFNEPKYKYYGDTSFPKELSLFFFESEIEKYNQIKIKRPLINSVALDSSGYYVMRSGRDENALYLVIDGGLAKYKPDHTHGGQLGIIMEAYGKEFLPNYHVIYGDPSFRTLKNSSVKNVALADKILLAQQWYSNTSRTGFGSWGKLPKPKVLAWIAGKNFDYFIGTHNGYENEGIEYTREIIFYKPFCWIVIDDFKSDKMYRPEIG